MSRHTLPTRISNPPGSTIHPIANSRAGYVARPCAVKAGPVGRPATHVRRTLLESEVRPTRWERRSSCLPTRQQWWIMRQPPVHARARRSEPDRQSCAMMADEWPLLDAGDQVASGQGV
jgi:hypothetical protein